VLAGLLDGIARIDSAGGQLPARLLRHAFNRAQRLRRSEHAFAARPAAAPLQLIRRLGKLGIPSRATRNAALLQLAAEVPPTVLADLLGLHPHTAVAWVKAAGGDWSRYAAHRSRATSTPPARQGRSR
jgi:hypothetical protein